MNIDTKEIFTKTPLEIVHIAYSTEILSNYFHRLPISLPEGLQEIDIEDHAVNYLREHQCEPAIKGYRNCPSDIGVSRNHVVAHGVPSHDMLEEDDVVTVDIVSKYLNWYADMSWTYAVGEMSKDTQYLLDSAWKVSCAAIQKIKVGNTLQDVAFAVQKTARKLDVHVYTEFVGHGIGKKIHEHPPIIYDKKGVPPIPIKSGMVLCIEPIISLKKQEILKLSDGSYIGLKKEKTAVYEHMVAVFDKRSKVISYKMLDVDEFPEDHPFL